MGPVQLVRMGSASRRVGGRSTNFSPAPTVIFTSSLDQRQMFNLSLTPINICASVYGPGPAYFSTLMYTIKVASPTLRDATTMKSSPRDSQPTGLWCWNAHVPSASRLLGPSDSSGGGGHAER